MGHERQALVLTVVSQLGLLRANLPRATREAIALLSDLMDREAAALGGARDALDVRGVLYRFEDTTSAALWCARVQRQALGLDWPAPLLLRPEAEEVRRDGVVSLRGPRLAMAVHHEHVDEFAGQHLGRLLDLTAGGRVLLSDAAAAHADPGRLVPDRLVSAGTGRLEGLPGDRPLMELQLDGLARGWGPPVPAPRGRYEGRDFFGRHGDLSALDELIGLGLRVVCVHGGDGIGKTRLLHRFARNRTVAGQSVALIDVDRCATPSDVLRALARAVDVPLREDLGDADATHRIATAVLTVPGRILVVDHAGSDASREALRAVVRMAPGSHWLIGGPTRLGVAGEVSYHLSSLPLDDARSADAVRLFDDRARIVSPAFQLGTGSEVHAIVAELEGNPLAIELAASLVEAVRPLTLFDRLTARRGPPLRVLDLLLEAMLDDDERALLSDLTAMTRPFSRQAALAVSRDPDGLPERLERFTRLGLVQRVEELGSPGLRRFRLHPRVRERLVERLAPDGGGTARLAGWLAARCAEWVEQLHDARGDLVLARLELELPEIEQVCARLLEQPRVGAQDLALLSWLLDARVQVAIRRGGVAPVLEALERALTAVGMCFDTEPMVAARLLRSRGLAWERLGEWEKAVADLRRVESMAERRAERFEVAMSRLYIGRSRLGQGRLDEAVDLLRRASDGFAQLERDIAAARANSALGAALTRRGQLDEADQVLDAAAACLDGRGGAGCRATLAERRALIARLRGRPDEALERLERALVEWRGLGLRDREAAIHLQLSSLLQATSALERARTHLVEAERLARRCGDEARRGLVLTQLGLVQLELGQRDIAHRTFIQAVSASRAGGDRAGQGAAMGFLGLLHHLSGRLEEARDGYRAALRDLESGGERRYGALFHSCLGAVQAELGNLDDARILVDLSQLQLGDDDAWIGPAMALFHRAVDLARAEAADAAGDTLAAKDLRAGVHAALATPPPAEESIVCRFARQHLLDLVGAQG